MFFKNLRIYKINLNLTHTELESQLARGAFKPCGSNEPSSRGWVRPDNNGMFAYSTNGQFLLALRIEEKILPNTVINQELQKRLDAVIADQGYAPGRKQLRELKERITEELLPRAFTKQRTTYAWIDSKNGILAIDASTHGKVDEVIDHLRFCIDDLKLSLINTVCSPTSAMADWLASGEAPSGFTIDRDCELKAVGEEKSAVRYVKHPLDGEEIEQEVKTHIASGKLPTKLAMTWDDRLSFVLNHDFSFKRLCFLDLIKEEAEKNAETADEQFDADFAIMTGELTSFIKSIIEALGGEVEESK